MNIRHVLSFPLVLTTLGLLAGNYEDNQKPEECAPLCYAGPVLDCDNNWDFSAGAIYEQVNVQGAEIATLTDRSSASFPANGVIVQQYEIPSWGFKIGAGYKNWSDSWRTSARYTWFKAISNANYAVGYGQMYMPSAYVNQYVDNLNGPATFGFQTINAGNYVLLQNANFLLGRPSLVTKNLELTTSYGVTATWFTRRQLAVFANDFNPSTGAVNASYPASLGGFFQNYQKYMFWGVGPIVSLHSVYYFGDSMGVYADAYAGVTYGVSDVRTATFSRRYTGGTSFAPVEAVLTNKMFQFSPEYNFQLGFLYSQTYKEDSVKGSFLIGYETAYYQQSMKTLTPDIAYRVENSAGLGIQGLVIQGQLDF
jgi:hypothetical protein